MNRFIYSKDRVITIITGGILLICYLIFFLRFFPNKNGSLGHDYSIVLPSLLDNFIWLKKNGLLEVPWFTPSFCGGFLNFAHPQSGVYSLPNIIILFFDPLSVVIITFVIFAVVGFLGSYLLLRSGFNLNQPPALLGAGLFLFNGFYSHRMIIGHFGFYCFMIIPLLTFFLVRPGTKINKSSLYHQIILDILVAGIFFAYMVHSGYLTLMLPSILAVVIIGIIHGLLYPSSRLLYWLRLLGSGLTGILLSSSKLVTIVYIMNNFTRSDYKLPGAAGFCASMWLIVKSIFTSPAFDIQRIESLINQQWYLDRHEWEYSMTLIPLAIIIWGLVKLGISLKKGNTHKIYSFLKDHYPAFIALALLLIIPIAINTYSPHWNAFLKKIPLIKSASSLIRWYIIYIPFIMLLSALIIEKTIVKKIQWPLTMLCLVAVVLINGFIKHDFYHDQFYNPQEIQDAYYDVKSGLWIPEVKYIAAYTDEAGQVIRQRFACNDMLIHNASQFLCYEPLLGYDLEHFPIKSLHPGPVLEENDGILNIKNPACYVWPEANSCNPGDQFTVNQKEEAMAFARYKPFHFKTPSIQKFANWFNLVLIVAVLLYAGLSMIRFFNSARGKG